MAEKNEKPEKVEQVDYLKKFGGAITIEKANEIFKENGEKAFHAAAQAGGYGMIKFPATQPLALPVEIVGGSEDENKAIRDQRAKINDALSNL